MPRLLLLAAISSASSCAEVNITMPEGSLKLTCADGVNRQLEAMRPNQCWDARNVWERGGKVVQRPGYAGVTGNTIGASFSSDPAVLIKEAIAGVFAAAAPGFDLDVSSLPVGAHWFVGFDSDPRQGCAVAVSALQSNTAASLYYAEYWNEETGSWALVLSDEVNADGMTSRHLGGVAYSMFGLAPSASWGMTTVAGYTKYFLRFTVVNTALDASVLLSNNASRPRVYTTGQVLFLGAAQFDTGRKFYSVMYRPGVDVIYSLSPRPGMPVGRSATYRTRTPLSGTGVVAQMAVVPGAGELYLALQNEVTMSRWDQTPDNGLSLAEQDLATVETADWAVGPGAPYDKTQLAQLSAFPKANLISYFQNRLWFADILGERNVVRWGAADGDKPYHRVLPALAYEPIDQKPTALKPLGENQVVYTQDGIHISVLDSFDAFGIPHFKFPRSVPGRGCVAPNSIQEINGRHIFLSEDGLYAYNGTPDVKKVTLDSKTGADRLEDVFQRVTSSARQFASSVHWRGQRVYMLSLPVDGSPTNNLTVVWDYEKDKFWLWDGIGAQFWLADNGPTNDETIYFGDSSGRIFQFGVGDTDHGTPIIPYLVTSPVGFNDSMHRGLSEVKVLAKNNVGQLNIAVWPNGLQSEAVSGNCSFVDYREAKWGTAIWGTSKWTDSNVRFRHHHFKEDGSYFQVKVSGAGEAGKPFALSRLDIRVFDKYEDTR